MRLTLHKGGCRPDFRGDKGVHSCAYALLPHLDSMNAQNVICPSYLFNYKPLVLHGSLKLNRLLGLDVDNVIVETIKPAEDGGKCFIARLYEAEGARTTAKVTVAPSVCKVAETNMLEEVQKVYESADNICLEFTPFEIKTLLITFA